MRLRLEGRLILFAEDAQAFDVAFEDDREFGRKVRTLAGNYQLFAWMPALLSPFSNPSWFETVSHKLLRLVSPWALAALVLACAGSLAVAEPTPVAARTLASTAAGRPGPVLPGRHASAPAPAGWAAWPAPSWS